MFVSHSEHLQDLKEMCTEDSNSNDILGISVFKASPRRRLGDKAVAARLA